jgi:hypothetical protein
MAFDIANYEVVSSSLIILSAVEQVIAFIVLGDALRRIKNVLKGQVSHVINLKSLALVFIAFGFFTVANVIYSYSCAVKGNWNFYTISTIIAVSMFIQA